MLLKRETRLAALGTDNGVEVWNVAKRANVLTLYVIYDPSAKTPADWIALTPYGDYDASPGGEQRLRWRDGDHFLTIEQSRALFHHPKRVQAALRGE